MKERRKNEKSQKKHSGTNIWRILLKHKYFGFVDTVVLCLECHRVSRTRDPMFSLELTISFKKNQGLLAHEVTSMLFKSPTNSYQKQENKR